MSKQSNKYDLEDTFQSPPVFKRKITSIILCCLALLSFSFTLLDSSKNKEINPVAVSGCNPITDIGGQVFFDANTNALADESIYTGNDGTLASSVGGTSGTSSENGIDGYAFPEIPTGGSKLTDPESFWGDRTVYNSPTNPNTEQKSQLPPDVNNIHVRLYDSTGQIDDIALDANGQWRKTNVTSLLPLRIEYSDISSGLSYTTDISTTSAQVHTASAPGCEFNVGFFDPDRYCQTNPNVALTCNYRNGYNNTTVFGLDYSAAEKLNDSNSDTVVNDLDASETTPNISRLPLSPSNFANNSETGPVFGVAYSRQSNRLFVSSVTSGSGGFLTGQPRIINSYGINGSGGIYSIDPTDPTPVATPFYSVSNVTSGSTYPTSIGTTGLGGLDTSSDGTRLYVVNISTKEIVELELQDITTTPSVLSETPISIPDPGCNANGSDTYRPFALRYWHEKIYIGTTCTHQRKGFIQQYDGTTWTTQYATNPNEIATIGGQSVEGGIYTDLGYYAPFFITGLDFESNGSIILGTSAGPGHTDNAQGEIFVVPTNGGTYSTPLVLQPGGQDYGNNTGGLTTLGGSGQILASAASPTTDRSNGLVWYNSSSQRAEKKYSFYRTQPSAYDGTLSESNAIGSIDLICDFAPIAMSGQVWKDSSLNSSLNNGVRDPSETLLSGVTVNLYDISDQLIGSTTTDIQGQWMFGGISNTNMLGINVVSANSTYKIRFDNPNDYQAGGPLDETTLTDYATLGSTQLSNSDAQEVNGYPEISYITTQNRNHVQGLDSGFAGPEEMTEPTVTTSSPPVTTSSPTTTTGTSSSTSTTIENPITSQPDELIQEGKQNQSTEKSSSRVMSEAKSKDGKSSGVLPKAIVAVRDFLTMAFINNTAIRAPIYLIVSFTICVLSFFFLAIKKRKKAIKKTIIESTTWIQDHGGMKDE